MIDLDPKEKELADEIFSLVCDDFDEDYHSEWSEAVRSTYPKQEINDADHSISMARNALENLFQNKRTNGRIFLYSLIENYETLIREFAYSMFHYGHITAQGEDKQKKS